MNTVDYADEELKLWRQLADKDAISKFHVVTIYEERDYKDRAEYLEAMSEEYDCPIDIVHALADVLGA
jgi:hypothetical protein